MIREFTDDEKIEIEQEIRRKKAIPAGGDFSYVWKYDQQDNAEDWRSEMIDLYSRYLEVVEEKKALEEELRAKSDYGLAMFFTMEEV